MERGERSPGPAGSTARGSRGAGEEPPGRGAGKVTPRESQRGELPPAAAPCRTSSPRNTYMPVVIQQIVGQFELIERNDLLHPLRPFGRGVRVVMDSPGGGGVGFAGHQPGGAVEGIPAGGEGTLSRGPGSSHPCPERLQHPRPAEPGPGRSPWPTEGEAPPLHHSRFLQPREERTFFRSQKCCRGDIIFYQVGDGTVLREIFRMEEIYSYPSRFGREATKASPFL